MSNSLTASLNNSDTEKGSVNDSRVPQKVDVFEPEDTPSFSKVESFPEGGTRGWLSICGAVLVQFTTFGYINSFGVYQDLYVRVYLSDYSPSAIGWIGGTQIFLNFSLGIIVGRVFDRGYFRHLMVLSLTLYSLALFMLSLSHKNSYYQVFLTHGVALGLASGLSYIPSLGIASHYFHRRRALAMGIVSSGSALGAIIHPIMLNRLFNGPVGFHNGVRISAAMNACLLAIACLLMQTRLPPRELKHFPIWEWVKEPAYFAMLVASCWTFLGLFFPVFYLQLDAILHGVDKNVAFYSLSVLSAASFIGRIIPGGLAHKFGVFNLLVLFTMATGVITLSMLSVHNNASTLIFSVFYGIFSGGAISLLAPVVGLLSKDMSEIGARLGILFGIGGILGLVATPIAGALLTNQHHWTRAILFAGISLVIASFSYAASRYFVAKKKGTQLI